MLNSVNNNDLNQHLSQASGTEKTQFLGVSNPYSKIDKNLLVDQLDISNTAIALYQKDQDIKKFTKLAMSDPDDMSHNFQVAEKLLNGDIDTGEGNVLEGLFGNTKFLKDILG